MSQGNKMGSLGARICILKILFSKMVSGQKSYQEFRETGPRGKVLSSFESIRWYFQSPVSASITERLNREQSASPQC